MTGSGPSRRHESGGAPASRFSSRLPAHGETNALSRAVASRQSHGERILDLTESNPTRAGLACPADLLAILSDPRGRFYDPQPLGWPGARHAVAADCARRGARVDAGQVILSASTSEAYSWLFKLLCDPGDAVLVPRPSYPLFEHLTRLEGVRVAPYDLEYHARWEIDFATLADAPGKTRAVLVVSPNNPTGSYLSGGELERLTALCAARRWALIVDEVFGDYALDETAPLTDVASRADVLSFTLGGVSKMLGLPQLKLGWTIVGGPAGDRQPAIDALELIADTFLSVSTPVQLAAPHLLRAAAPMREAIHARVRGNLGALRAAAAAYPSCEVLHAGGGWSAVVRVPATRSEEALALELLTDEGVLIHPGYFFDFQREAFLVLSLLPPPQEFGEGVERVLRRAASPV